VLSSIRDLYRKRLRFWDPAKLLLLVVSFSFRYC